MTEKHEAERWGRRAGNLVHGLSGVVNDLWRMVPSAPSEPPAFPAFETLWKVADETVDWTDALAGIASDAALTDDNLWRVAQTYAKRVLAGDTSAYLAVLEAAKPLADLSAYAKRFDVVAVSPDRLEALFEALPVYLNETGTESKRYLAGMAVRMARDLFALLPVTAVQIRATKNEQTLLEVSFEKTEMLKVRFAFIDPVDFTEACGGVFSLS